MKRKNYRKLKKEILVKSFGSKCCICGYDKVIKGLEFHHRDENLKIFNISQSANVKWSVLLNEVEKCILVCCRCHREIHEKLHDLNKIEQNIDVNKIRNLFKPNNGRGVKIKSIKKCLCCGEETFGKYCSIKCSAKSQEVIKWNDDELIDLYVNKNTNVHNLCKKYNVSYNSVKKRLKKLKVFKNNMAPQYSGYYISLSRKKCEFDSRWSRQKAVYAAHHRTVMLCNE